jgi:hypothetical protein
MNLLPVKMNNVILLFVENNSREESKFGFFKT